MRMLCRSVDPTIKVRDQGERRALIDVLSVPRQSERDIRIVCGAANVPSVEKRSMKKCNKAV